MDSEIEYGDEAAEYSDEQPNLDKQVKQQVTVPQSIVPVEIERIEPDMPEPVPVPEETAPKKSAWQWIGSPDRPEAQKSVDGISDLFEFNNEADTDDLTSVDVERDIVDADADGSLDSLVTVTEEDIMGYGPYSQPRKHNTKRIRRQPQQNTDPRIGGLR